ncbi:TRAP transporter fused permease subunit [Ferrovibrio sp.]|uniref:TRAP transporter permease n=1 Tax=Ferrovibrio sp. TaxID=1917215 RepID=UPI0025BDF800|nr:TRAP transporter fused permease subunit [Ferrovibrio sp.]MBX3455586.1 TRAP transporter fused permease subunit [Ferrovibrio sp.]
MTQISSLIGRIVGPIGVAMALYHMYAIAIAPPEAMIYRAIHLSFALTLVLLLYPFAKAEDGSRRFVWIDVLWFAGATLALGHLFVNYDYFINRIIYIDDLKPLDAVAAVMLVVVVLDCTRRVIGWALPITAMVFMGHALFFTRVDPLTLLDQLYMTTEGIFGSTLGVSAAYVMVFVMFGSFMERTGTGRLFMDFALSLTGRSAGGPGKVAVVSSSLFGTISGSAVANVMVDGPITIPLMKRTGFSKAFAAGVESVASTGGQIMPPIMGAAAFVMAEFLAVPYAQVALWALIPSVLYYVACFGAVHFEAKRRGLLGLPPAEVPFLKLVLIERGHLFIPVAIILGGMFAGYSAPLCALAGTLACFPVALLRASSREGLSFRLIWEALEDGARNTLAVALACACAGLVIGSITLTGLGISFTNAIVGLAQNSLLLALLLTAVAGIILGMGMPTTPAYIVMVSLMVPAIIKLGVIEQAAHMFAFYFAILSAITPPVALAVYAAASLAKANIWDAGWSAVRIGAAGFIVPFMFVYEPALLFIGDPLTIIHASISAVIGCLALAAGLNGHLIRHAVLWERLALVAAALLLIKPGIYTDLAGLALIVLVYMVQRQRPPETAGISVKES